jgi:hypothetical protein
MKAFSTFFGKFPFAGKFAIRNFFSAMYRSNTFSERLKSYLGLLGLLAVYCLGHGMQVLMGARLMYTQNVPFWAILAGFLYASINGAAIVTHIYLALRATVLMLSNRYAKTPHQINSCSGAEFLIAIVATLAGQFGFLAIYYLFV